MKKLPFPTKIITVDVYLSVSTQQYFEVPLDYKIYGSSPEEAYQNIIDDLNDDDCPNVLYKPEHLDLGEYGCDLNCLGNEFEIYNPNEKTVQVKRFESPKSKKGRR